MEKLIKHECIAITGLYVFVVGQRIYGNVLFKKLIIVTEHNTNLFL